MRIRLPPNKACKTRSQWTFDKLDRVTLQSYVRYCFWRRETRRKPVDATSP